jgi:hypothetical protein
MTRSNRKTQRSRRTEQASAYVIPNICVAPAYPVTLRLALQVTAPTTAGLYTMDLSPNKIQLLVFDQIANSRILSQDVTSAPGSVVLTPVSTTPAFTYLRIKGAHIWGISGGSADVQHVTIGTSTALIPATPKLNAQSAGSSSKPCAYLAYPNEQGRAFDATSSNSVIRFSFEGVPAGLTSDNSVIIDVHVVMFD